MPKKLRPAVDLMAFKCRKLKVKVAKFGRARWVGRILRLRKIDFRRVF
jgi:hypothetical protein